LIPLVIAGISALVGAAAVFIFEEGDKKQLRKTIVDLERSHNDMERRLRNATQRESQQRLERLRLLLSWSKSRLETILERKEAPLDVLRRVWAIGKALSEIERSLPADGSLSDAQKTFVDAILKAQQQKELTHVERAQIDDFLAEQLPEALREFYEDRLTSEFRRHHAKLIVLRKEQVVVGREMRVLQLRAEVEGLRDAALARSKARLEQIDEELERHEREERLIKRNLVIVTRLARLDESEFDEYDDSAQKILERLVRGEELTSEDAHYLDAYRDKYYLEARGVLKQKRGIDLAAIEVVA
jgi:hypothetical protein